MNELILIRMGLTKKTGTVEKAYNQFRYRTERFVLTLSRNGRFVQAELFNRKMNDSITYTFASMADFTKCCRA